MEASAQLSLDVVGAAPVTSSRTIFVDADTGDHRPAKKELPAGCVTCNTSGGEKRHTLHPLVYCIVRRGEGGLCYCPDHLEGALRERRLPVPEKL